MAEKSQSFLVVLQKPFPGQLAESGRRIHVDTFDFQSEHCRGTSVAL